MARSWEPEMAVRTRQWADPVLDGNARRDAFSGSGQQQQGGEEGPTLGDRHVMEHGSVALR
jgi:hypothetical protein